jgi:carboxymethylenebutenolidase
MRRSAFVVAAAAVAGFVLARSRPATATDDHAVHNHDAPADAAVAGQQGTNIPASGATAADRIARSPRHGEWAAVRVSPTDSVMAWVVYPERRDKAPVVVVIHENTGLTTWARSVADQLAAEGFIAVAPDMLTPRRKGNLTTDWTPDSGRAAIGSLTVEEVNRSLDAVAKYAMSLPAALPGGVGGRSSMRSTPPASARPWSTTVRRPAPSSSYRSRRPCSDSTAATTSGSTRWFRQPTAR